MAMTKKHRFIQTCPYGCCTEVGNPNGGKTKKLANRLTRRRANRFWKKEEN
jgi:hypothetical protein